MVTIIIPTYNRPILLKRALNSVLNQSYTDLEIIVVNDAKEENDIKNSIKNLNDKRIIYLKNERKKGGNGSRNTGILHAKGEYVAFLDDDDEFMPEKIKTSVENMKLSKNCVGNFGMYYYIQNNNCYKSKPILIEINQKNFLFGKINLLAGSNLFIKKNVLIKIGMWNENLQRFQDLELVLRILNQYKLNFINKVLIKVYGHDIYKLPNANLIRENKTIYFELIKDYIKKLTKKEQNKYYSIQYRELALNFGYEGNIKKMLYYLKKSFNSKILNPIKYMRFVLILIKKCLNLDLQKTWSKLKYLIEYNKEF